MLKCDWSLDFFKKIAFEQSREEINAKIVIWAKPSIFFLNLFFRYFFLVCPGTRVKNAGSAREQQQNFFFGTFEYFENFSRREEMSLEFYEYRGVQMLKISFKSVFQTC